mmetsp:Transcript_16370/g.25312  ORF Transcript_16370/g.25312 Transcript_16370/m.25312 type:complete len:138 (-) Transcript_16370:511-924(-)
MVVDCPPNLKAATCHLRFVRNANDLKTKQSSIDNSGLAEFNEKIEMKTQIEFDSATNKYKRKVAQLHAELSDGTAIGSTQLDLADFVRPDKYLKQLTLSNLMSGISSRSFITVEIKTFEASKPSDQSPGKRGLEAQG